MSFSEMQAGHVAVDTQDRRWRITRRLQRSSGQLTGWQGRAIIDGAVVTKDLGTVGGIASVEPPEDYSGGVEVSVDGIPGTVLDGWDGTHGKVYAVRLHRDVQPFGAQLDDVRQVHQFAIDP